MKLIFQLMVACFISVGLAHGIERSIKIESPVPDPPVKVAYYTEYDVCLAGRPHLGPNRENPVMRVSPKSSAKVVTELMTGHIVPVCEERGDWLGIIYKPNDDPDDNGLEECDAYRSGKAETFFSYQGPCLSGWMHRKFIGELAG